MDRISTFSTSTTNGTYISVTPGNPSTVNLATTEYLGALDLWAVTEKNGAVVAEKIRQWLHDGKPDATLNLSELALHSLPPLPANLKRLKADKNLLVNIPENYLPATLEALDVHRNQLTSLPDALPIGHLKLLNVAGNKLNVLPASAFLLNIECKVFFSENNLDPALLTAHFGPEQNLNGMRRISSKADYIQRQAKGVERLANAISLWMPSGEAGMHLSSQDVLGMTSFANFLDQMGKAPFVRNAALNNSIREVIKKMATDLTFCKKIFKFTIDNVNGSHYQLAWSLFKINYLSTALLR